MRAAHLREGEITAGAGHICRRGRRRPRSTGFCRTSSPPSCTCRPEPCAWLCGIADYGHSSRPHTASPTGGSTRGCRSRSSRGCSTCRCSSPPRRTTAVAAHLVRGAARPRGRADVRRLTAARRGGVDATYLEDGATGSVGVRPTGGNADFVQARQAALRSARSVAGELALAAVAGAGIVRAARTARGAQDTILVARQTAAGVRTACRCMEAPRDAVAAAEELAAARADLPQSQLIAVVGARRIDVQQQEDRQRTICQQPEWAGRDLRGGRSGAIERPSHCWIDLPTGGRRSSPAFRRDRYTIVGISVKLITWATQPPASQVPETIHVTCAIPRRSLARADAPGAQDARDSARR